MEPTAILTTSIFLFMAFGFGYAALLLARPKPLVDTILLSLVVGLGMLPLVILLLRILHIPMDVRILIFLAAVGPAIGIWFSRKPTGKVSIQRYACIGIVLIAAVLVAAMMYIGATTYPYLENDDPWGHAVGAHYVAFEKTTWQPQVTLSHYLEPYPPYFTAMMGILHQSNNDLQWVLKFFNALIIGMSIIAAFYAFEALTKDSVRAALGAVIIGVLPAYMSHFIWSQTLAIPVFFIALWAVASIEPAKQWHKSEGLLLAVLLVWSATIIQPSTAAVFALLFIIYAAVSGIIAWKETSRWPIAQSAAIVGGGMLSFLTWAGFVLRYGWEAFSGQIGINSATLGAGDTSGGIIYSLKDIIFAPSSSKIDQATGLGWFVCILVVVALIVLLLQWRKLGTMKNSSRTFMLAALVACLVGIQGNALPIKLFPHRFWVFLAIPAAFLAADIIMIIASTMKREALKYTVAAIIVAIVILTSIGPRLAVQQAMWPPGVSWSSNEELGAYIQMKEVLPKQTKIFSLCSREDRLIGMNLHAEPWDPALQAFKEQVPNLTGDEIISFMLSHEYRYVVLDAHCIEILGVNGTQQLGDKMTQTNMFQPVIQQPGIMVVALRQ